MAEQIFAVYAFGRESSLKQAIFCIHSLIQCYASDKSYRPKLLIFTDNPNYFQTYFTPGSVEIIALDSQTMIDWKGQPTDNFRVKLKALESSCLRFPMATIILVDSDTFVVESLDSIYADLMEGIVYFHDDEGILNAGNECF